MTEDETTTAEMLLEALQQRAFLYTQCAHTTVITAQIDQMSTGGIIFTTTWTSGTRARSEYTWGGNPCL